MDEAPASINFHWAIVDFTRTLSALGELLDDLLPRAQELDENAHELESIIKAEVSALDSDAKATAKRELKELVATFFPPMAEALLDGLQRLEDEGHDQEIVVDFNDPETLHASFTETRALKLAWEDKYGHELNMAKFIGGIRHMATPPVRRAELLLRSLVITSVSAFEVLLTALLSRYFRTHPGVLDAREKRFSLEDLTEFNSLSEATERYLEQRVEEVVREGHSAVMRFFRSKDRLNIPVQDLALDWQQVLEILERRHVLVHHGGRVSQQYLAKIEHREVELGSPLGVTPKYAREVLSQLRTLGVLIAAHTEDKLAKGEAGRVAGLVIGESYQALLREDWDVARHVCVKALGLRLDQRSGLMLKVNAWIARKALNDSDELRREVERWDTSAYGPEFLMAKAALLDDHDTTLQLVQHCIDNEIMRESDVREWPLLREFRTSEQFNALSLPAEDVGSEEVRAEEAAKGSPGRLVFRVGRSQATTREAKSRSGEGYSGSSAAS